MAHKVLEFIHSVARRTIISGDAAVDATAGNGHDTVVLARTVGIGGRVWAFDVQSRALSATHGRLEASGMLDRVQLVRDTHVHIAAYVTRPIAVALFNLGYLPGGCRSIQTRADSTIAAAGAAWGLLRPGGVLLVVAYPRHPGGREETQALLGWVRELADPAVCPVRFGFSHPTGAPPLAVAVRKPWIRSDPTGTDQDQPCPG